MCRVILTSALVFGLFVLWVTVVSSLIAEPLFYPDKSKLLVYRDASGTEHPVTTAAGWARRRADILANMQQVMGPLPDATRKVPLDVQVTEEVKTARYVRKKLTFAPEKGDRVPASLLGH